MKLYQLLYEVDWRIDPLEHVVTGIDAGLDSIKGQIDDPERPEWYDVDDALRAANTLLGLGLVAFQTYALGTVEDLKHIRTGRRKPRMPDRKSKHAFKLDCYSQDPIVLSGGVT